MYKDLFILMSTLLLYCCFRLYPHRMVFLIMYKYSLYYIFVFTRHAHTGFHFWSQSLWSHVTQVFQACIMFSLLMMVIKNYAPHTEIYVTGFVKRGLPHTSNSEDMGDH